jgi:hypothetical protein
MDQNGDFIHHDNNTDSNREELFDSVIFRYGEHFIGGIDVPIFLMKGGEICRRCHEEEKNSYNSCHCLQCNIFHVHGYAP